MLISGARISKTFRFTMSEAQFRTFIEGRVDNMRNMVMSLSIMNPREPPPPEAGREREARMVVADEATVFFHQIADVATVMWADIFQKYLATVLWLDFYDQRDPRHESLTQTTSDVIALNLGRIVIDKSSDREPPLINPEPNIVKEGSSDTSVFTITAELTEEGFFSTR